MILTKMQAETVKRSIDWYYGQTLSKPLFIVGGVAGAGKSSTISSIINALNIGHQNVLFATLTGRAACVLRMKGLNASTIHKTFYNTRAFKGRVFFKKKPFIPRFISLICLDEFSMIPDDIINDILSFGIPVLASGDPFQLPPIQAVNSYLSMDSVDVMLTETMRTDDKSGVLKLSTMIRNGEIPKVGKYGASRVIDNKKKLRKLSSYDKILCWTNKTRRYINYLVRQEKKIKSIYPLKNETINMLHNNYEYSINYMDIPINVINGLECYMTSDAKVGNEDSISISCRPKFVKSKAQFKLKANKLIYDGYMDKVPDLRDLIGIDIEKERDYIYTDFSYAISVHASQGGEWDNVLVLNEMPSNRDEYYMWLYTSVTRAIKSVDILI